MKYTCIFKKYFVSAEEMLQCLLCSIIVLCRFRFVQTKVPGSIGPEPWGSTFQYAAIW